MIKFFNLASLKVWLSLLFYVSVIIFVISPDSYFHNSMDHVDSAWFFMEGKAWMNGMIPYVDFTDSKGPLLFLITGMGYLISSYNFIGVFWLSCLWYSITLFFCYKIGTLLTQSQRKGYVVALLMAFPYFCCLFHYETRAEDWCQPFLAASLYYLLKEILHPTKDTSRNAGIIFGITFMATLLIKWSIAVMSLSFVASVLLILMKRKQSILSFCICFAISAIVIFIPFGIYMYFTDSLGAFAYEYFLNTGKTVSEGGLFGFIKSYCKDIAKLLIKDGKYLYIIYLVAIFCYSRKKHSLTILPFLCGLFFVAISIRRDNWHYYLNAASVFAIFLVVIIVEYIGQRRNLDTKDIVAIYFIAIILNWANMARGLKRGSLFFQGKGIKEYYDAAYIMSQKNSPKILNGGHELGIGLPAHTLPATLYYSGQIGQTKEMKESRLDAIRKHIPDFITVSQKDTTAFRKTVISSGYKYYITVPLPEGKIELYGRLGLRLPPKDYQVFPKDILLKRKIKLYNLSDDK